MMNSASFLQVPFSFLPKIYKEVNMKWALWMKLFVHVFQSSLTSYTTEDCFKSWLKFLHDMHPLIRAESNPRYDLIVLTIAEKYGTGATCVHTAEDLF